MALTISIDRTSLSLSPLVFSDSTTDGGWGILPGFLLPAAQPNVAYAGSPFHHGSTAVQWTYQQALLQWDANVLVATPADLTTAVEEAKAAMARLAYEVTVDWNGQVSTWTCDPGSLTPAALDFYEATKNRPTFSVTIPCYPVPS